MYKKIIYTYIVCIYNKKYVKKKNKKKKENKKKKKDFYQNIFFSYMKSSILDVGLKIFYKKK